MSDLLIINRTQFGYHVNTLFYSRYLKQHYKVNFLCWDYGKPRTQVDGVTVTYVSRRGPKVLRYLRFFFSAAWHVLRTRGVTVVEYFPGCAFLPAFGRKGKLVLNIRTGCVSRNALRRWMNNSLLSVETAFFDHVMVISESLGRKLGLPVRKLHVLPLGANVISEGIKRFNTLRFLYVGTLHQRRIEETLVGLRLFLDNDGADVLCKYKIIGTGYGREEESLRRLVPRLGLEGVVDVVGFVQHDHLRSYFDESNVGVSYIPMTEFYDVQPPTKTFEYLLSGMPVIATETQENKRVVNSSNGVLIPSNPEGFYEGLKRLKGRLRGFESGRIRKSVEPYLWENIILRNLKPYLDGIIGGKCNAPEKGSEIGA
jgi:glycosyltransferase involved in cell wall biosynthesis